MATQGQLSEFFQRIARLERTVALLKSELESSVERSRQAEEATHRRMEELSRRMRPD